METNSCTSCNSSKSKGILIGLLLVVAGILFLSFNIGWIDASLRSVIFSWPMIIVVIGILGFSKNNYFASIFLFIIGGFFLIPRIAMTYPGVMPGVDGNFAHTYWPFLLILFGICLIFKVGFRKHRSNVGRVIAHSVINEGDGGNVNIHVVFGGSESIFLDPVFNGGSISAVFGGVVLDLRNTQLREGETYLNIDATFGGVELHIPGDWWVESKIQSVLAGVEDKRLVMPPDLTKKLILTGDIVLSGCEIR